MYKDSKNTKNIRNIKLANGDRKIDMFFRKLTNFTVYSFMFMVMLIIWMAGTYQHQVIKLLLTLFVRFMLSGGVVIISYLWHKFYKCWDNKYLDLD